MRYDFYLAHPINMRHKIRDELQKPLQELGYAVRNPFYGEDLKPRHPRVAKIDEGIWKPYDFGPKMSQEIVESDLNDINSVDSVIAYLPQPGIGTSMELFYASHVTKKYTFVATAKDYLRHPWVQTYGDVKRETLQDIIAAICEEDI